MEKLKRVSWVHLAIGSFALIVIAYAVNTMFGHLFALVYLTTMVCLYVLEAITAKREKEYVSLTDLEIARQIVLNAYQTGKINRTAFVKGELYLTREWNIKRMALGSVRRGSRIELEKPVVTQYKGWDFV